MDASLKCIPQQSKGKSDTCITKIKADSQGSQYSSVEASGSTAGAVL